MTTPTNGYVPSEFLAPLVDSVPPVDAEKNTASAYARLHEAHPESSITGLAAGYWSRAVDEAIRVDPAKYDIVDKGLSPVGASPHGLGTRINFHNISPAVAAQFGFREYNSYTFDYTGVPSWGQVPAAVIEHNLTAAEVKRVAAYLNVRNLGRTTTAAVTGINVVSGSGSSNYYWEIQKAGKIDGVYPADDLLNGIPGPATYEAERYYRDLTAPITPATAAPATAAPAPSVTPVTSAPPTAPAPAPTSAPVTPPATSPDTPIRVAPVKKVPPVTSPTPLSAAQVSADRATLQTDSDQLSASITDEPLAGLLASHTVARKRAYIAYASTALVISFGPDVVVAGVLTTHTAPVAVAIIGLASSVLLKIGVAFGFVAASNAK